MNFINRFDQLLRLTEGHILEATQMTQMLITNGVFHIPNKFYDELKPAWLEDKAAFRFRQFTYETLLSRQRMLAFDVDYWVANLLDLIRKRVSDTDDKAVDVYGILTDMLVATKPFVDDLYGRTSFLPSNSCSFPDYNNTLAYTAYAVLAGWTVSESEWKSVHNETAKSSQVSDDTGNSGSFQVMSFSQPADELKFLDAFELDDLNPNAELPNI